MPVEDAKIDTMIRKIDERLDTMYLKRQIFQDLRRNLQRIQLVPDYDNAPAADATGQVEMPMVKPVDKELGTVITDERRQEIYDVVLSKAVDYGFILNGIDEEEEG